MDHPLAFGSSPIYFLILWEEDRDGTSGPSLLVTHYNQLPKVLLCPQNPVGETQASIC